MSVPMAVSQSAVERGRIVYQSEECKRCHSQNNRPDTEGASGRQLAESRDDHPARTGNRTQGPDLSDVGDRRSELWLKMHLYNPREVSGSSIMPPYEFLFRSKKGNNLVAYLANLRNSPNSHRLADQQAWHLSADAVAAADPAEGQKLYNHYCATCHNASGRTRLKWQSEFIESPAVLRAGAMQAQPGATDHLAQIIKFGIPDSDMAGHENLPDKAIASLAAWLTQKDTQPVCKH